MSTTDLDALLAEEPETEKVKPLTVEEIKRLAKLEKAVAVFEKEIKAFKDQAKAYYIQEHGITKGREEIAGVEFVFDVVQPNDLKATAEKFPIEEHPDLWITPEPVPFLDLEAIAPKDIVKAKPSLRLSVKS